MQPNNRIMEPDTRLQEMCEAIKEHVESQHNDGKIWSDECDGVEIGYRVKEFKTFIRDEIFIKTPGNDIGEISVEERTRIMAAVFNVFLVPGAGMPEIKQIAYDAILLTQNFIPTVQVEQSPGLVSIAGGFNARSIQ